MWFLIRGAFWFSLVLVMLPIFDQDATDRLAKEQGVELTDAHDAHADACAAAELVPKILDRFPDLSVLSPRELHASQVSWRAEQQTSLCEYFERIGNLEAAASISKAWPLERVSDS